MNEQLSVGRVISLLGALAHGWPDDVMLYSHAGRLYLIRRSTGKVYWSTLLIAADGGHSTTLVTVDKKGGEYIEW